MRSDVLVGSVSARLALAAGLSRGSDSFGLLACAAAPWKGLGSGLGLLSSTALSSSAREVKTVLKKCPCLTLTLD